MTTSRIKPYMYTFLHVMGWALLGFLLLFYVPLTWNIVVPNIFWLWQSLVLCMMIVLFYVNAASIMPATIIKGKPTGFVLWITAAILLMQLITYFFKIQTGMDEKMHAMLGDRHKTNSYFDSFIFTITSLVLGISTSFALLRNWQQSAQLHQQLEQEKTIAELAMLKTQINPHFFFNTLNNIYSLTYINADDARKGLHTLSRMMRYLLYGTESEKTTLSKEIVFLNDYIMLMRLRTSDKLKLSVEFPDKIEDYSIAPMLLLPFVENAFKHGVDATEHSEIKISLTQKKEHIEFKVLNNIFTKTNLQEEEGGIGLVNTQRRLQLVYPSTHQLIAGVNNDGNYEVNLSLILS